MVFWYNIGIAAYAFGIKIAAILGNTKAQLFRNGRKNQFQNIGLALQNESRKSIWFLVSSLGEFEQARPLIESVKLQYPQYPIILTFFSPSGFEVKKKYDKADYIFYLPLDSKANAKRMIGLINPALVFFTKYDFWYHYLHQFKKQSIPTMLFSAVFQSRQPFFKWYGSLHRKMLTYFTHLFVQDADSINLLASIDVKNTSIAGDTRIDSVIAGKKDLPVFDQIVKFKGEKKLIIGGSVWKKDWKLLLEAYTDLSSTYQLVLAPHDINDIQLQVFQKDCKDLSSVLYSEYKEEGTEAQILILNTMGMLSKIYQYADVVWIGGGFQKSGIHNVLEPAVFDLPIFIGPNYKKFIEATALTNAGGIRSLQSSSDLVLAINDLPHLKNMQKINAAFIKENAGAVKKIMDYLKLEKYLDTTP